MRKNLKANDITLSSFSDRQGFGNIDSVVEAIRIYAEEQEVKWIGTHFNFDRYVN